MEIKALYKKFLKHKGISAPKNKVQSKKPITVSNVGLWDKSKKKVIVPSNRITMKGPKGEQDFFKRPVLATGLQSGKQVLMQPGGEYYFPEDKQVFEKRMQGGGELVLDAASMIPGPVGMTASGLGLAYDVAEGDWVGAGLNTANILTGGSAKGLMAAARVANNAGTRNLARGLASGSHNLNRASKVANNYSKPVDTTRNINNLLQDNYQTQRGGYQDNTRLAPTVRPVKPRMQDGGTVQTNMLQPIKKDEESLPVILDSLFSQFQKTKQEFGVEPEEPETPSLQTGGHVIQPGETFFGIANKYNLTKEDLIDANPDVDINTIQIGQSLKIPVIESVGQVEINAAAAKTPTKWFDYVNPMNWGAPNYDDAGNFRQAFRKARIEGENDFMWYGDRYSSDLANLENKRQELVKDIAEETETLEPIKTNRRKVNEQLPTSTGINNDILLRQAYKESTFDPKAKSSAGYMGLAQIGDEVIKDYKKATGIRNVDAYNPEQNAAVQRWAMNQIYNSDFVNKKNQTDEVRLAKTLASYNWGKGNVRNYLKRQKAKGVDIYNSLDWLEGLPQETKDYVHKIQLKDAPDFDAEFNRAIKDKRYSPYVELYQNKANGGIINTFQIHKVL